MTVEFKALNKIIEDLYNEDLVCPYCGAKQQDTWELDEGEGEIECLACEKTFKFTKEYIVKFRVTE